MMIVKNYKILAVALIVTGLFTLVACKDRGATSGPPPGPPQVSVVTIEPQPLMITTELTGRTVPHRVAEVRPQVSGLIQKRLFTEGADVAVGQPLYQIDPAPLQAALDGAEANLVAVQKTAERARAALQASQASLSRQRATLALAETNKERFEEAFKVKAVSAIQRDQAVTEHTVALAGLQAVAAQVDSDIKAIAAAEAAIAQAEAVLRGARINLSYTTITAPIGGRIGRSSVNEGALVTGQQPLALATIQQLDPIYVDVPQSTAERLRLQQRLEGNGLARSRARKGARLLLEDGSSYSLAGTLQFRDITVDPTTGSFILRILFPNPKGILLPGMFVRAVVEEGVNPQTLLVPQQAVSRTPKGDPLVMLVNAESKAELRPIVIERAVGNAWVVSSGLAPGDQVIVEGLQRIRPGMPVVAVALADKPASPGTAPKTDPGQGR